MATESNPKQSVPSELHLTAQDIVLLGTISPDFLQNDLEVT